MRRQSRLGSLTCRNLDRGGKLQRAALYSSAKAPRALKHVADDRPLLAQTLPEAWLVGEHRRRRFGWGDNNAGSLPPGGIFSPRWATRRQVGSMWTAQFPRA